MVAVNYFAVLVSAVASMVLGSLWYGPIFGKPWMKLMGITKEKMEQSKKKGGMWVSYLLMFAGSLVTAFVLAHFLTYASAYTSTAGYMAGLMVGFWSWLGFVGPVTLGSVLWEEKPWALWFLNSGYYIVNLLMMGVILAVWL